MYEDDILREIWATREAFAAAHNYDLRAMSAALRAEELASDRVVVSFAPRPVKHVYVEQEEEALDVLFVTIPEDQIGIDEAK